MGFMGLPYQKYGEQEKDILSYAIAVEEYQKVDGGTGLFYLHVSLGSYPFLLFGTEEQRKIPCTFS